MTSNLSCFELIKVLVAARRRHRTGCQLHHLHPRGHPITRGHPRPFTTPTHGGRWQLDDLHGASGTPFVPSSGGLDGDGHDLLDPSHRVGLDGLDLDGLGTSRYIHRPQLLQKLCSLQAAQDGGVAHRVGHGQAHWDAIGVGVGSHVQRLLKF